MERQQLNLYSRSTKRDRNHRMASQIESPYGHTVSEIWRGFRCSLEPHRNFEGRAVVSGITTDMAAAA